MLRHNDVRPWWQKIHLSSSTLFCRHHCNNTLFTSVEDVLIASIMPVTLRNGKVADPAANDMSEQAETRARPTPTKPSPYLLLLYPFVLALGSLYSHISPYAHTLPIEPLAAGAISSATAPSSHQPSYFAGKGNLVNILFVKRGWLWTTLAFVFLQLTTRFVTSQSSPLTAREKSRNHYLQAVLRYILITTSWIFVTQWFFGPPLVDRSFTLTGGHCEGLPAKLSDSTTEDKIAKVAAVYSSGACKRVGGSWRGGHDISGHVFMLVLSSAFLLYELYIADTHSAHPSVSARAAFNVAHGMSEDEKRAIGGWETEGEARLRVYARYFLYAVVALDVLMMFTTAVWFHTWLEKLNGMLIAGISVYATYFLGEFVPAWGAIVGTIP